MKKTSNYLALLTFLFTLILSPSLWAQRKQSKTKTIHQEIPVSKLGGLEWRMVGPFRGGR